MSSQHFNAAIFRIIVQSGIIVTVTHLFGFLCLSSLLYVDKGSVVLEANQTSRQAETQVNNNMFQKRNKIIEPKTTCIQLTMKQKIYCSTTT